MIKGFKDFLKKIEPILIPVDPVHGGHARTPAILIPVDPVHGAHSKLTESKMFKEFDDYNSHIGADHFSVSRVLALSKEEFAKHPGSEHLKEYTNHSGKVNHNLLARQLKTKPSWHKDVHPERGFYSDADREAIKKEHKDMVQGIDKALKASKLKHDVHVFHGTDRFNPGELAAKHPEGHIRSAAYLSTSLSPRVAHSYASLNRSDGHVGHILHIHLKKGQSAMHLGHNSHFSAEYETLLPRDSVLKIHPKPTKLDTGVHVWHAHVVD